ncbi:MAG: hypothetical protein U0V04_18915 [Spirosomataceae bacterium]|jgi:hypothetical protein
MKKYLLFIYILCACKDNSIYNEYEKFNKLWYLESVEGLPFTLSNIQFVNFGNCKISKKIARVESSGCLAPINSFNFGGTVVQYSLKPNSIVEISEISTIPIESSNGTTVFINQTDTEKKLEDELKGSWKYFFTENKLILKKELKSITFKL